MGKVNELSPVWYGLTCYKQCKHLTRCLHSKLVRKTCLQIKNKLVGKHESVDSIQSSNRGWGVALW
jgi:hypothetical protein